jgi:signal transduction histidine kinase
MNSSAAHPAPIAGFERIEARQPLAQLLHALNQPLTGLQCSMEVALASPRTVEQYVQGLREGLELTERMRALVEAIREVADVDAAGSGKEPIQETTELHSLLEEIAGDLAPVAESKGVWVAFDGSSTSTSGLMVKAKRPRLAGLMFRLIESAVSLADWGTALRIEIDRGLNPDTGPARIRIEWRTKKKSSRSAFSRSELGLLVVQAGLERLGAKWRRAPAAADGTPNGDLEAVTIHLASVADSLSDQGGKTGQEA